MSTIIQVEQQPQLNVSVEENTEVIVVNVTQSPDIKIEVSGVVYEGSNVDLTNYYTKPESDARFKPINYVPTWSSITGKPTFFSGNYNDLTNKPTLFDGNYNSLSNIPTTFPPSTHDHSENQITITVGTYFASVGQYQRQFNQAVSDWRDNIQLQIDDLDSGKADVNHTHTIGQITHLQTTLDGKANLSHTHTISQVTNLQNALDDKLNIPLSIDGYYAFWSNSIGNYTSGFLYQNATGVGIDTSNPTEKLDVGGRVKSDGLVLNETTSAILPKEIKLKDGKIKAALTDGVEKAVLLEGDVSGFDFNALVDIFQYSNFQFIRPSFNTTNYFQYANDGANVFQAGHVAYTNLSTYQRHGIQYKSATTTVGRCNGNFRGYIEKYSYSSFNTSVQFAITSNIPTQRVFVGYSDQWRQPGFNPTNVAMNTLIDVIGVCMDSGSSNLFIIHNDVSGTANLIDTGFTHNTNYLYTLRISKKVNSTIINVVLERVLTTTGVKSTFSYDITNDYTITGGYLAMYCIDALGTTETSIVDFGTLKTKRLNYLA